jgi:hypothetical protein
MLLVHMTDVHFYRPPGIGGVFSKRAMGLANLHLLGRSGHFDADSVVPGAVQDALSFEPDAFAMTGDLSALASRSEFAAAREAFAPLLDRVPSVVVPGNHDRYTRGAVRDRRIEEHFAPFLAGGSWDADAHRWVGGERPVRWPASFRLGETLFVATDPCRPTLGSTGRYPPGALEAAERAVREALDGGLQVVYLLHYPPLDEHGAVYDRASHMLQGVEELLASFRRAAPHLVLHGHKHRCWRTGMTGDDGGLVTVLNCGTTSAVADDADRTAGYYLIDLEGGQLRSVRRRIRLASTGAWSDHPGTFETP